VKRFVRQVSFVPLIFFLLAASGCEKFRPVPMEEVPFRERARTMSDDELRVTVAALSAKESEMIFGVDLASRNVQPVWMEIENKGRKPYWLFPIRTDPNYYSPAEVAYMKRFRFSPSKNRKLRAHIEKLSLSHIVSPHETSSGFIYTNMDPGLKYVNVSLLGLAGVKSFRMVVKVPGIRADYQEVDFQTLYTPEEYIDCDENILRAELEKLPCCTTNSGGTRNGDPLNLVFMGNMEDLLAAFARGGWKVTEQLSPGAVWRTIRSFLFGQEYQHSPVSSLYVFGRRQDAAFQKARGTVKERNHLRVWLTALRFKGLPVWIGQISRDIGIKLTLGTGFPVTHVIDADVDNDRYYLLQNLTDAGAITRLGYVGDVGRTSPDDPGYNLGGDPYFTDGLRAVMMCTDEPASIPEIEFFDWKFPPDIEPWRDEIINRRQ